MSSLNIHEQPNADRPSTKEMLKDLILRSLNVRYTSESCKDGIKTGNHYQSVILGDIQTKGFRTDRSGFLDNINFEGKKVLDLGSNLGEISRAARIRGAYLVDGFEYDPYFLEIAGLVNVYNQVTRVSFYQRNITDPSIYGEHYDIVLAFSVFTYIRSVLDQIAAITDQVFVLETHKLEGDLAGYLAPILQHFPCYKILGESEWGTSLDAGEKRAIVVFAKEEAVLAGMLEGEMGKPRSAVRSVALTANSQLIPSNEGARYIDASRTSWYDSFFSTFRFNSPEELIAAIGHMQADVDTMSKSREMRKGLSGWSYWLLYIKGYLQYVDTAKIGEGNAYYDYLTKYFGPQGHDPGLSGILANPGMIVERIAWRFRDFDSFQNHPAHTPIEVKNIDPIIVIISDPPTNEVKLVYEVGSNIPLQASTIDGYHRLFLSRLFRVERLPCELIQEVHTVPERSSVKTRATTCVVSKGSELDKNHDQYQFNRMRKIMHFILPRNAKVVVVSKGDEEMLKLGRQEGWHYAQSEEDWYTGHDPADSADAIAYLEKLRIKGSEFLIFPSTSFWWLERLEDFRQRLDACARRIWSHESCIIYQLS